MDDSSILHITSLNGDRDRASPVLIFRLDDGLRLSAFIHSSVIPFKYYACQIDESP